MFDTPPWRTCGAQRALTAAERSPYNGRAQSEHALVTSLQLLEVLLVAVFAGAFGAMLGLGGGIVLVPALMSILGVPARTAVATSIVSVIATSSAGAIGYLRERYADVRLALLLESATTVGAVTGALIALLLNARVVAALFAALLVYAAVHLCRREPKYEPPTKDTSGNAIRGEYHDKASGQRVAYAARAVPTGLAAGFFAGNVSAILGVGGGIIMVPVMVSRMGIPMRVAAATSTLMIGVTAVATAVPYYAAGEVDPHLAAPCALGVLLGAQIGSRLQQRTRARTLRILFACALLATAIKMAHTAGLLKVIGL